MKSSHSPWLQKRLAMTAAALTVLVATSAATALEQIKYGEQAGAAKRMTLLLRDFHPRTMLHVPVHDVTRARFPVWDVHNHVNDARGIGERIPPEQLIRSMDNANVAKIVILTGAWGKNLQSVLDKMVKPYPDRFIVFTQIDWSRLHDANFSWMTRCVAAPEA